MLYAFDLSHSKRSCMAPDGMGTAFFCHAFFTRMLYPPNLSAVRFPCAPAAMRKMISHPLSSLSIIPPAFDFLVFVISCIPSRLHNKYSVFLCFYSKKRKTKSGDDANAPPSRLGAVPFLCRHSTRVVTCKGIVNACRTASSSRMYYWWHPRQ